jgi:hypothetical protein
MHKVSAYLILVIGAYLCQTVLYPVVLAPELRVDLFLILVVHFSFSCGRAWTLVTALFLGLLMDVGLPVKGSFHPLLYMAVALAGSVLWQNLNLQSRRYQAVFFGVCSLLEGLGIWVLLRLQSAEVAATPYLVQILVGRVMSTSLCGPLLLSVLEMLDNWLNSYLQEFQEG